MVIGSLPGGQLWHGFQAESLAALRAVRLAALRAVAEVLIPALVHPGLLAAVQEALPVALLEAPPDFRNRLVEKKTRTPLLRASCVFPFA
jgi:hypothetical protein